MKSHDDSNGVKVPPARKELASPAPRVVVEVSGSRSVADLLALGTGDDETRYGCHGR